MKTNCVRRNTTLFQQVTSNFSKSCWSKAVLGVLLIASTGCGIKIGNPEGQRPPGTDKPAAFTELTNIKAGVILERTLESLTTGDYLFRTRTDLVEPASSCQKNPSDSSLSFTHSSSVARKTSENLDIKVNQSFTDKISVASEASCDSNNELPEFQLSQFSLSRSFDNSRNRAQLAPSSTEASTNWSVAGKGRVELDYQTKSAALVEAKYSFDSNEILTLKDSTKEMQLKSDSPLATEWQAQSENLKLLIKSGKVSGSSEGEILTFEFQNVLLKTTECLPVSGVLTLKLESSPDARELQYDFDTKLFKDTQTEEILKINIDRCLFAY